MRLKNVSQWRIQAPPPLFLPNTVKKSPKLAKIYQKNLGGLETSGAPLSTDPGSATAEHLLKVLWRYRVYKNLNYQLPPEKLDKFLTSSLPADHSWSSGLKRLV